MSRDNREVIALMLTGDRLSEMSDVERNGLVKSLGHLGNVTVVRQGESHLVPTNRADLYFFAEKSGKSKNVATQAWSRLSSYAVKITRAYDEAQASGKPMPSQPRLSITDGGIDSFELLTVSDYLNSREHYIHGMGDGIVGLIHSFVDENIRPLVESEEYLVVHRESA